MVFATTNCRLSPIGNSFISFEDPVTSCTSLSIEGHNARRAHSVPCGYVPYHVDRAAESPRRTYLNRLDKNARSLRAYVKEDVDDVMCSPRNDVSSRDAEACGEDEQEMCAPEFAWPDTDDEGEYYPEQVHWRTPQEHDDCRFQDCDASPCGIRLPCVSMSGQEQAANQMPSTPSGDGRSYPNVAIGGSASLTAVRHLVLDQQLFCQSPLAANSGCQSFTSAPAGVVASPALLRHAFEDGVFCQSPLASIGGCHTSSCHTSSCVSAGGFASPVLHRHVIDEGLLCQSPLASTGGIQASACASTGGFASPAFERRVPNEGMFCQSPLAMSAGNVSSPVSFNIPAEEFISLPPVPLLPGQLLRTPAPSNGLPVLLGGARGKPPTTPKAEASPPYSPTSCHDTFSMERLPTPSKTEAAWQAETDFMSPCHAHATRSTLSSGDHRVPIGTLLSRKGIRMDEHNAEGVALTPGLVTGGENLNGARTRSKRVSVSYAGTVQRDEATSTLRSNSKQEHMSEFTTVMIRNLPSTMSQSTLLDELDKSEFVGAYDFCYMPSSLDTGEGRGFAFVNFVKASVAAEFMSSWHGRIIDGQKLNTSVAEIQGSEANLRKWSNPRMQRIRNPQRKPFVRASLTADAHEIRDPVSSLR
eukprot:TRINITY_DN14184_c0_g1_i1.p1 TRINITY_DN14184_c0_g1~~TRINITY_DN14184_c0_g1_i1.p1  ORF type:complete len:643 (-),score=61.66 TRINITY_DN14184_c0_g1_i1:125-2053(-)